MAANSNHSMAHGSSNNSNNNNWCPECSAVCTDHGSVCTICGSFLTANPPPAVTTATTTTTATGAAVVAVHDEVLVRPAPQRNPALIVVENPHSSINNNNNNNNLRFQDFDRRIQILQAQGADLLARTGQLRTSVADMAALQMMRDNRRHSTTNSTTTATTTAGGDNTTDATTTRQNSTNRTMIPTDDNAELFLMIQQLTQQITDLRNNLTGLEAHNGVGRQEWPYLLASTSTGGSAGGVPQTVLDGLPREHLTDRSSILKVATLTWDLLPSSSEAAATTVAVSTYSTGTTTTKKVLQVVPAEFGARHVDLQNVKLVSSRQTATRWLDDDNHNNDNDDDGNLTGAILVLRRGDITFAHKARAAQQRGAVGLIIVNDRAAPWPYIMTDSTNEAADVTIPVVMVPQGTQFPTTGWDNNNTSTCTGGGWVVSLTIQENADLTCCVCTESFCNTTSLRLPKCQHLFHEDCALTWLSRHNSCPYCRSPVSGGGDSATTNNNNNAAVHDMATTAAAFYG